MVGGFGKFSVPSRFQTFCPTLRPENTKFAPQNKEKPLSSGIEEASSLDITRAGKYTVAEWLRLWFEV